MDSSLNPHGSLAVYLVLAAWVPFALWLFWRLQAPLAVVVGLIGGWLFLPSATVHFPYIFYTDKPTAVCLTLLIAALIFARRPLLALRPHPVDLPIFIWCVVPLFSALLNGIAPADALRAAFYQTVAWGIPYVLGRAYLADLKGLRTLALGLVIGGLIYIPLCWFEIAFGPNLHLWLYGFYPSPVGYELRFGGWRPIVFMLHGLMVGLWMAAATVSAFWLWYSGAVNKLWQIPMLPLILALAVTTIAVKSVNGWILGSLGLVLLWSSTRFNIARWIYAGAVGICAYISVRIAGFWNPTELSALGAFIGKDTSIYYRVEYERLIAAHAREQPLWGWGSFDRAMVRAGDYTTIVDSQWIGAFGIWGLFGLVSLLATLLLPVVRFLHQVPASQWRNPQLAPAVALAVVLFLFALDNMLNSMFNPVYLLAAGGVMGLTLARLPSKE